MNTGHKIGALIPMRMGSERLPGKALRLINGRPVVLHLLDRAAESRYLSLDRIVVCTTEADDDDSLVEAVIAHGASVFRGHSHDIIKRFHGAVEQYDFDAVVQIDGDDPLTEPEYMDLTMERLLSDPSLGIVWTEDLPIGINCKSFTRAALRTVFSCYCPGQNDTGFIYLFTKTDLVKQALVRPVDPLHVLAGARLTLDYEADLEFFDTLFRALESEGQPTTLGAVVSMLRKRPEIVSINAGLEKEYWERTRKKVALRYRDAEGLDCSISI